MRVSVELNKQALHILPSVMCPFILKKLFISFGILSSLHFIISLILFFYISLIIVLSQYIDSFGFIFSITGLVFGVSSWKFENVFSVAFAV